MKTTTTRTPVNNTSADDRKQHIVDVLEEGGGARCGARAAAAFAHRLRIRRTVERNKPPAVMVGQRRGVEIYTKLYPSVGFDSAVIRREHGKFAQAREAAVGQAQDDAKWLVEERRCAGVEQRFGRGVDARNASFGIDNDQRAGHRRNQCFGARPARHGDQAAARDSHGS